MTLECQRPDLVVKPLMKKAFPNLICGIYTNDHAPNCQDSFKDYVIGSFIELDKDLWEYTIDRDGWSAIHPKVEIFGNQISYGYAVYTKKNILLWAERFNFVLKPEKDGKVVDQWSLELTPVFKLN